MATQGLIMRFLAIITCVTNIMINRGTEQRRLAFGEPEGPHAKLNPNFVFCHGATIAESSDLISDDAQP